MFNRQPRMIFSYSLFSPLARCCLIGLMLLVGLPTTVRAQQKKTITTGKTTPATQTRPAASADDDLPNDPAIEAESRRLAALRVEAQRKLESELAAKNAATQTPSGDLWRRFRQTFPFHSQVVALSDAVADGSRTLIVSEPPPHVTLGDVLTTVGGDLLLNHLVEKHKIGFDGWVKDVVIAVKGNDESLQAMLSRLHQRLFFTSYKSYTLKLPSEVRPRQYNLNLRVTPEELKFWVMDKGEQFFPVEGGKAETLASLGKEQSSGVYVSKGRGLIGWWVPKSRHIYDCRVQARQFSLDADLIVGAISNPTGILVLGRERIVPVDILPPLRIETLTLLADVQDGQKGMLAQSYERNHEFAGRIEDNKDWAPILLSPELRDTEYGSLLNITDQLLKSWSNHGETAYINFDYPIPPRWPFAASLSQVLKARQLTYNWNTKGVGYTLNFGNTDIFALNRSGSLPVSYIPDGMGAAITREVEQAQETGYNYFSSINDPNLVRVVQYAALYQIFSAFDIARSSQPIPKDEYPGKLIDTLTKDIYADLRRATDAELSSLALQITQLAYDRKSLDEMIVREANDELEQGRKRIDAELRKAKYTPGTKEYNQEFDRLLELFKKDQAARIESGVAKFYQARTVEIKRQLDSIKLNRPATTESDKSLRKMVLSGVASLKRMPQRYAEAVERNARSGWIHTPAVVLSWDRGGLYIGGHNLDARVTKVVTDESVPVGQVKIDTDRGGLVFKINPKEAPRARDLARNIERKELVLDLARAARDRDAMKFASVQAEMNNLLARAETVPVRPRETALGFAGSPPAPPKPPRKPPISAGEASPGNGASWEGGGNEPILVAAERREPEALRVTMLTDGRYNYEHGTAGPKQAYGLKNLTHEDMIDVVIVEAARRSKNGEPVVVEFGAMPEHKALASLRTMETRLAQQNRAVELVGLRSGESLPDAKIVNWQEAAGHRIGTSEIETMSNGLLRQDVVLEIQAPARTSRFNVRLLFSQLTPRNVIAAVTARVNRAFSGLAKRFGSQTPAATYNKQLARAVKKIKGRTKLDFEFTVNEQQGLGDIYIGQKGRGYGQPAFAIATGESE